MAGEAEECVFESRGAGGSFEGGKSVASEEASGVDHGDAVGEEFDLGQSVRGEEQRSIAAAEDFGFEEAAKIGGGDRVEAAGGFIEEEDAGLVEQGASEAEALDCAGGKRAHLAVQGFFEMELLGENGDALCGGGIRKMIEAAKEAQILAAGEAGVEADVAAGVVAELAANGARVENGVMSGDLCAAAGREQKRGENAEESGLARAICAEQRQCFAGT